MNLKKIADTSFKVVKSSPYLLPAIKIKCCILYSVRSFPWTGDINQVDLRRHSALEVTKNIKLV